MHPTDPTIKRAAEIARKAISWLAKNQIASNPINYTIAYEYHTDMNKDLVKALNARIKSNNMSPDVLNEIYRDHILKSDQHHVSRFREASRLRRELQMIQAETIRAMTDHLSDCRPLDSILSSVITKLKSNDTSANATIIQDLAKTLETVNKKINSTQIRIRDQQDETIRLQVKYQNESVSTLDPLTGSLNSYGINTQMKEASQYRECALVVMGIDNANRFSESFGILVKEQVIKYVSSVIKNNISDNDIVGRLSEEGFALLIVDSSLSRAIEIAEGIQKLIADSDLRKTNNEESIGQVTVSIGITHKRASDGFEGSIDRAQKALITSKERGINLLAKDSPALKTVHV